MNMKYQNSLGIFYKIINLGETHTMSSTITCISQATLLMKHHLAKPKLLNIKKDGYIHEKFKTVQYINICIYM